MISGGSQVHLHVCPEMHAIANIANIAEFLSLLQILKISQIGIAENINV